MRDLTNKIIFINSIDGECFQGKVICQNDSDIELELYSDVGEALGIGIFFYHNLSSILVDHVELDRLKLNLQINPIS